MRYDSIEELIRTAKEQGLSIGTAVLRHQAEQGETSVEALKQRMAEALDVMRTSSVEGEGENVRSVTGLTGGDGFKMKRQVEAGKTICGKVFGNALAKSLSVAQTNACMGKIVAAPTAGSCGILPAALLAVAEDKGIEDEKVVEALFAASGVGMVIAARASLAGAEGGCQAECGAASAMAGAALVELCGGEPVMAGHAVAIALKNVLGLVCDPVAGLVEIPCIKRNAMGVTNALCAAELALAGIESAIPADEVIDAMKRIGDGMASSLKETAEGGLAMTPTGRRLYEEVFGDGR